MGATIAVVTAAIAGVAWWLIAVAKADIGQVNAIRAALTAGAAAGGGMGLLLAFRRQQYHETDATEQRITGRYTAAIDQLGSDKPDVRVGGIYALERIARDSPADHPTIIDVLATFIRAHAGIDDADPLPPSWVAAPPTTAPKVQEEDVRAATIVIARRDATHDLPSIRLEIPRADAHNAHLPNAHLAWAWLFEANLAGTELSGAKLAAAELSRANLAGAGLANANLTGANLTDAHLVGAILCDADLTKATLMGANLTDANLTGAELTRASLTHTNLTHTNLTGANLTGANLGGADLTHTNLTGANLTGADLGDTLLISATLDNVTYDEATRWPEAFTAPE